jgi:hypothetical protein
MGEIKRRRGTWRMLMDEMGRLMGQMGRLMHWMGRSESV